MINIPCSSPLLFTLQSNIVSRNHRNTRGCSLNRAVRLYGGLLLHLTWLIWCNTLCDGVLKIAFLLCIYQAAFH